MKPNEVASQFIHRPSYFQFVVLTILDILQLLDAVVVSKNIKLRKTRSNAGILKAVKAILQQKKNEVVSFSNCQTEADFYLLIFC